MLAQVSEGQLAEVRAPQDFGLAPIARIHIAYYLDFLPGVLPARHLRMGARIPALGKPTLFVMKGGYAVAEIGINAVNLLEGFRGG